MRISGEVDIATSPILRDCLQSLDGQSVRIDFSDVTFLDSSGLSVLVNRLKEIGHDKLVLQGVQPAQMRVFEVTGVDEFFQFDG